MYISEIKYDSSMQNADLLSELALCSYSSSQVHFGCMLVDLSSFSVRLFVVVFVSIAKHLFHHTTNLLVWSCCLIKLCCAHIHLVKYTLGAC